eukprot:TRINITY_DN14043_c0_g1_i1.p1 TRINITY_DN14043_c0_g1~~TRINITY_DN14043_c0_g1_i1.p1  ORF type:complete len:390 (+),score=79.03 TRINITY_DN14043_c0_g1_i1:139-1308(+)
MIRGKLAALCILFAFVGTVTSLTDCPTAMRDGTLLDYIYAGDALIKPGALDFISGVNKAIECYRAAALRDTNNPLVWERLGDAYQFLKQHTQASIFYDRVSGFTGTGPMTMLQAKLVESFYRSNQAFRADPYINLVLQHGPSEQSADVILHVARVMDELKVAHVRTFYAIARGCRDCTQSCRDEVNTYLSPPPPPSRPTTLPRVLIVSGTAQEPDLVTVRAALEALRIPYDVYATAPIAVTPGLLTGDLMPLLRDAAAASSPESEQSSASATTASATTASATTASGSASEVVGRYAVLIVTTRNLEGARPELLADMQEYCRIFNARMVILVDKPNLSDVLDGFEIPSEEAASGIEDDTIGHSISDQDLAAEPSDPEVPDGDSSDIRDEL